MINLDALLLRRADEQARAYDPREEAPELLCKCGRPATNKKRRECHACDMKRHRANRKPPKRLCACGCGRALRPQNSTGYAAECQRHHKAFRRAA